jgi:hypothetical protein
MEVLGAIVVLVLGVIAGLGVIAVLEAPVALLVESEFQIQVLQKMLLEFPHRGNLKQLVSQDRSILSRQHLLVLVFNKRL